MGTVQIATDEVNRIAVVGDLARHLNNCQFVARCVEDPRDIMPVGCGDENVIDGEVTEEDGRIWDDHGLQWVRKESPFRGAHVRG